jgi:hypothetical protein
MRSPRGTRMMMLSSRSMELLIPRISGSIKRIEQMTDEGAFERLALAVLRRIAPDCGSVFHEGMNADGKTVPAPLDGFGMVPGSDPPHFVMVACTTTARDSLRAKWLFDHMNPAVPRKKARRSSTLAGGPADDGDLVKAIRRAGELRAQFPTASFKIYLVSNRLGMGDLVTLTTSVSNGRGIETEIVEASRLGDFLDFDPRGQWLRYHFFGTPVVNVSDDLLRAVGLASLRRRGARHDFNTARRIISRECEKEVAGSLSSQSTGLLWLVAPPGKGKSVLTVEAAKCHSQKGGFALWISEQDVLAAETLDQAMESAMRREQPHLQRGSGSEAIKLANPSQRFLLLFDDLNRLTDPESAFRKLRSWMKLFPGRETTDQAADGSSYPCIAVCPIWPQHFGNLLRTFTQDRLPAGESEIHVPNFSSAELQAVFDKTHLTASEIEAAADEFSQDPFLCAVYADELRTTENKSITATHVLERYMRRELETVGSVCGHPWSEYRVALEHLAEAMLRRKIIRPTWSYIINWFAQNTAVHDRLRELVTVRKIIHIDPTSEVVLFTHDRFLTLMCASRVSALLQDTDVIGDPYFAEIVGRALATSAFDDAEIANLVDTSPLAGFFALQVCRDEFLQRRIATVLETWAEAHCDDEDVPDGLWWQITLVLVKTDAHQVVDLTKIIPTNRNLPLAALRNGSALGGVDCCLNSGEGWFLPAVRDQYRDSIVQHAVKHHADKLGGELSTFLLRANLNIKERRSGLVLAGFMRLRRLELGITGCWRQCPATERPKIIAETLWALGGCTEKPPSDLLAEVLGEWERMPSPGTDLLDDIAVDALAHCPPTWLSDDFARCLITTLPSYPRLRPSLEHVICASDTPAAFEFQVARMADGMRESKSTSFLFISLSLSRWAESMAHETISPDSRLLLKTLWSDLSVREENRESAFALWLLSATPADLDTLRSFSPGDALFPRALRKRMQLQDRTTLPLVAERVSNDWSLLSDIPAIWSESLYQAILQTFEKHGDAIFYGGRGSAFLLAIPPSDADRLIEALWSRFQHQKDLVTAALLVPTSTSTALATQLLGAAKNIDQLLEHTRFVMMTSHPYVNRDELIPYWLRQCTPHLCRASQETLRGFSMLCRSPQTWRWHDTYVKPFLRPESRREVDERMELTNLEEHYRQSPSLIYGAHDFFAQIDERGYDRRQTLERIAAEAASASTLENVAWLAACIAVAGDRRDLAALDRYATSMSAGVFRKLRTACSFTVRRRTLGPDGEGVKVTA